MNLENRFFYRLVKVTYIFSLIVFIILIFFFLYDTFPSATIPDNKKSSIICDNGKKYLLEANHFLLLEYDDQLTSYDNKKAENICGYQNATNDYSKMSDEELAKLAGVKLMPKKNLSDVELQKKYAHISDEELLKDEQASKNKNMTDKETKELLEKAKNSIPSSKNESGTYIPTAEDFNASNDPKQSAGAEGGGAYQGKYSLKIVYKPRDWFRYIYNILECILAGIIYYALSNIVRETLIYLAFGRKFLWDWIFIIKK